MQLADTTKKIISILVIAAFIILVEWYLGWAEVMRPWRALSWVEVLLAISLIIMSYQLRTLRIFDYFYEDMQGKWLITFKLVLIHNVLNNFLPMRSGEISFPLLMLNYFKIGYGRSLPALLWFRLLDLHTILTLGMFSLIPDSVSLSQKILITLLWLSLPLFLYVLRGWLLRFCSDAKGIQAVIKTSLYGLPNKNWQFIKCWIFTWLNWLLKLLVLVWVLGKFISLDFMPMLLAVIAGELTSVLPFHAPGGVGTYEVGIVTPLLPYTSGELATAAAINVHLFILCASVFGGLIGYFIPRGKVSTD